MGEAWLLPGSRLVSDPLRSAGAPERTRSHYAAILALLRERGPAGVLGSELYDAPHFYGRSPRNRISELRRDGHLIEGKPHGSSDWRYVLIRENQNPTQRPQHTKRAEQAALSDSRDWFEEATGKPRSSGKPEEKIDGLPLLAEARR